MALLIDTLALQTLLRALPYPHVVAACPFVAAETSAVLSGAALVLDALPQLAIFVQVDDRHWSQPSPPVRLLSRPGQL